MMRYAWAAIMMVGVVGIAGGQTNPASGVKADETLVSPTNAKVYLEIGQTMLNGMDEMRRAASTVTLSEEQRQAFKGIIDEFEGVVTRLMQDLKKDPLPPRTRVSEMEAVMQGVGGKINQALGAEGAAKLRERTNSPRFQARIWARKAQWGVPRALGLEGDAKENVVAVFNTVLARTEELSDSDKDLQAQAGKLDAFFERARNEALQALSADQQATLKNLYRPLFRGEKPSAPRGTQPSSK